MPLRTHTHAHKYTLTHSHKQIDDLILILLINRITANNKQNKSNSFPTLMMVKLSSLLSLV